MNIMEEIFEIMSRSCVEIVVNSKTIDTTYQLIDWAWFYVCANTI